MRMLRPVAWIVVITASAGIANAGGSTAFTYQGRLFDAGEPANGLFDFEFSLWDAAAGPNQVGATQVLPGVLVTDGLFTVQIDFGADVFDNADRWLEISVDGVPLSPRQPITRAPYSIQTRGIFVDQDQNVGIGTTAPQFPLHVREGAGSGWPPYPIEFAIVGDSENGVGVSGITGATEAAGVVGGLVTPFGEGSGVFGFAETPDGYGGDFENHANGVALQAWSPDGIGVYADTTPDERAAAAARFVASQTADIAVLGHVGDSGGPFPPEFDVAVFGHAESTVGSTDSRTASAPMPSVS